MSAFVGVYLI